MLVSLTWLSHWQGAGLFYINIPTQSDNTELRLPSVGFSYLKAGVTNPAEIVSLPRINPEFATCAPRLPRNGYADLKKQS